jgi:hypothetical protein
MDIIGLFVELLLFGIGLYLYLFSRGRVKVDAKYKDRAEAFRKSNQGWMRILSLGLMAIMLVNIILHIMQMIG